jgi:acetyltransferase-like isoleucine patch superfamily enzyme
MVREGLKSVKEIKSVTRVIHAFNIIIDYIFPPIRWLMFPFRFLILVSEWARVLLWILSNEFSKLQFGKCGRGVHLNGRLHVTAPENLVIGDNVHINDNTFLRAEGGISIGNHTHISRNVVIYSMNHQYEGELLPYDNQKILKPVKIGSNVWIGMNVTIIPGVTIGDGAIIGLGTLVSQDVPPLSVVGNSPMRIIKQRNKEHYLSHINTDMHGGVGGYGWR